MKLESLKKIVNEFEEQGFDNVTIIENDSSKTIFFAEKENNTLTCEVYRKVIIEEEEILCTKGNK